MILLNSDSYLAAEAHLCKSLGLPTNIFGQLSYPVVVNQLLHALVRQEKTPDDWEYRTVRAMVVNMAEIGRDGSAEYRQLLDPAYIDSLLPFTSQESTT